MKIGRYIAAIAVAACGAMVLRAQTAAPAASASSMHEITLPRYQPNLPPAPGRAAFATACLACHTDRYVATQPPFPEAKWEAEVHKMAKIYGCYITDEQVPLIAKYAVSLQKSPEGTMVSPVPTVEPGPTVNIVDNSATRAQGQALFAKDCYICHVAALQSSLKNKLALPLPTDLSTTAFSTQALSADIHNSVPGTAMPAFSYLGDKDLNALIVYVQSLSPKPEHVTPTPEAKQLYMTNCLACHGASGSGDGFANAALPRPAANFCAQQPSADFAYRVISNGIAGTSMPQWKTKFSEAQRHELANYVRSLYHQG